MGAPSYKDYGFCHAGESHMVPHLMPPILAFAGDLKPGARVLDVGCGNGFVSGIFLRLGCTVVGIDLSRQGIEWARRSYSQARFELMGAGPEMLQQLGEEPFDIVVSTEVVEHLYSPREWAHGCFKALRPGGCLICSTPYHGYLKNLLISLLGKWDSHLDPLWEGGHIKLWSRRTLSALLTEAGFTGLEFRGAGRMPGVWMTMVAKALKPLGTT
jgi:2-polyprenyl-3-methyl-5-hydroxy-6-metoxy-1,4-benzoquinol methylase